MNTYSRWGLLLAFWLAFGSFGAPGETSSVVASWSWSDARAREIIKAAAVEAGVPPLLMVALCEVESELRWWVIGDDGEIGLCQVKPIAAFSALGGPIPPWMLMDPNVNALTGAKYLQSCFARFGYWPAALDCYNRGPSRTRRRRLGSQFPKSSYPHRVSMRWRTAELIEEFNRKRALLLACSKCEVK